MDYIELTKRSFKLVKKNPVLWVYAAIMTIFSGTGYNFSSNFSNFSRFSSKSSSSGSAIKNQEALNFLSETGRNLLAFLASVPITFWLTLALGIFLTLVASYLISVFILNWSFTAYIKLSDEASKGEVISLKRGSDYGRKFWLRTFLISLVIGLLLAMLMTSVITITVLMALIPVIGWIILIIFGLPLFLGIILMVLFASQWIIFSGLVIVLEDYSFKKALSFSFELTKKFFWQGIVMGIINSLVGCLSGCVMSLVIGLLIVIVLLAVLFGKLVGILFPVVIGAIMVLMMILAGLIINVLIRAVQTTNWVLFYHEIKKEEKFKSLTI